VAQRLVRKICVKCRVKSDPTELDILRWGCPPISPSTTGRMSGVQRTGYKGRTGIYEILTFTQPIRDLIASNATENEIRQAAISRGW